MKRGITAVSSAILVVVITILSSVVVISSYSSIENSKRTVFAIELSNIQENVTRYYEDSLNNEYPTNNSKYTLDLSSVTSSSLDQFSGELRINKQVYLYEVDFSLLGITDTAYGNKKTEDDVYVLSKETGKVYYVQGIKANNKTYYTLTEDLINIKARRNISQPEITYTSLGITTDGYYVKKLSNNKKEVYLSGIKVSGSNIKYVKYEFGIVPASSAEEYFKGNGKTLVGDRIKVENRTFITIYIENNNGDSLLRYIGYGGNVMEEDPATLHSIYVDQSNNTAPIPAGFVASKATGETEINDGLVIYEGTTDVTNSNVATAMESRNQYVWVPVDDITVFVRRDGYSDGVLQTHVSSGAASEPYDSLSELNDPTGEVAEYAAMYNSVKKYGGFYIARYEAGSATERTSATNTTLIPSQKNKYSYNYIKWGTSMTDVSGGAVELSRSVYPSTSNKGAISTLIYGVQFDATIKFLGDIQNTTINPNVPFVQDSSNMGWYNDNKSNNSTHKTGIDVTESKLNKVKNIYDLAGNVYTWTMEASSYSGGCRVNRGGAFTKTNGYTHPVSKRSSNATYLQRDYFGFRIALYMK